MSRRSRRDDRQHRRHLVDLEKGLRRADATLAVAALLALPETQRAPHLEAVAALLASAIRPNRDASSPATLHSLAVHGVAEPRLIDTLGDDGRAVAWTLGWACVAVRDWPRAMALLGRALPELAEAEDRLTRTLCGWLRAAGEPDPVQFEASLPADLRAGLYAAVTTAPPPVAPPPPPANIDAVDHAVLVAFAGQPLHEAVALVIDWADAAELRDAIVAVAARQVTVHALRQRGVVAPCLDALSRLSRLAPLPAATVGPILRLADALLLTAPRFDEPPPQALIAASELCASHPAMRTLPLRWLQRGISTWEEALYHEAVAVPSRSFDAGWIGIARIVSEATHDARALAWLLALWAHRRGSGTGVAPQWLREAVKATIAAGAAADWGSWEELPSLVKEGALDALDHDWPTALLVDLIEAWIPALDEFERQGFGAAAATLVELESAVVEATTLPVSAATLRETAREARRLQAAGEPALLVIGALYDIGVPPGLCERIVFANRSILDGGTVSAEGRTLWRRLAPWLVPLRIDYLHRHVAIAVDGDEVCEGLGLWLDGHCHRAGLQMAVGACRPRVQHGDDDFERRFDAVLMANAPRCALFIEAIHGDALGALSQFPLGKIADRYLTLLDATIGARTATMLAAEKVAHGWRAEAT